MFYVSELEKGHAEEVTVKLSYHLCALTAMLNTGEYVTVSVFHNFCFN